VKNTTLFPLQKQPKPLQLLSTFTFEFSTHMARTNKRGIAANKAKLQKQAARLKGAKRFEYPTRKLTIEEGKELGVIGVVTNPKGHDYTRFLRGRKICRETRLRVDPDGYRYIKTPSGGGESVSVEVSGWTRKRMIKATRQR